MNTERTGLFVDLISLFHNISLAYSGRKLDYKLYLSKLREESSIYRAVAYGAAINDEADNFIKCLRGNGYEVKYVPAKRFNNNPVIKYTDRSIDIIMDIIRMLDRLDVVVIGSSNINFIPLIIFLKEKGIKVVIYACNISKDLKAVCDSWVEISEDLLEENYEEVENDSTKTK